MDDKAENVVKAGNAVNDADEAARIRKMARDAAETSAILHDDVENDSSDIAIGQVLLYIVGFLIYIFIDYIDIDYVEWVITDFVYILEWVVFFCFSIPFAVIFFKRWYGNLKNIWPPGRNALAQKVFVALPAAVGVIIFFTLKELASWDLVESFTYVVYYIVMGYAVVYIGLKLMCSKLDLYWDHDAIHNDNKAAVPAVAGGFIALTVIYSGAHVGDGPGWWCVIFACLLGYAAWFLLWKIFHLFTGIFERVTVGRDVCCGIRLCGYFIATGIILGRASAGDWSGFFATMAEFTDGWPVLPLMALMAVVELLFYKEETDEVKPHLFSSVTVCVLFIAAAILAVMFYIAPLPENPEYGAIPRKSESSEGITIKLTAKQFDAIIGLPHYEQIEILEIHAKIQGLISEDAKLEKNNYSVELASPSDLMTIDIEERTFDSLMALPYYKRYDAINDYLRANRLIPEEQSVNFEGEE